MTKATGSSELVERLRNITRGYGPREHMFVNPDGPEAADALDAKDRTIERLREVEQSFLYLCKWVERGLFDKTVTPKEALEVIAHSPVMPWRSGRWDVDHKPYAAAFYEKFPTALKGQTP